MDKIILHIIENYKKTNNEFDIFLKNFYAKINYLAYSLNYPEAKTDLIIYLIDLIKTIDINKFECDTQVIAYINKCLKNKSIYLAKKVNKEKYCTYITDDINLLDNLGNKTKYMPHEFSNIYFYDIISKLTYKQKKIVFYKYYLQFSDMEIADELNISRQAVNKTNRLALENLKKYYYKKG